MTEKKAIFDILKKGIIFYLELTQARKVRNKNTFKLVILS